LRGIGFVEHARLSLVHDRDLAHAIARAPPVARLDVDLVIGRQRAQECEVRIAMRDDDAVAPGGGRRRAAHVAGAERERTRAGRIEDVEIGYWLPARPSTKAGDGHARDRAHVRPRPRAPRAAVPRVFPRGGDEAL